MILYLVAGLGWAGLVQQRYILFRFLSPPPPLYFQPSGYPSRLQPM